MCDSYPKEEVGGCVDESGVPLFLHVTNTSSSTKTNQKTSMLFTHPVPWTRREDEALIKGLQVYSKGAWKEILEDIELSTQFHINRRITDLKDSEFHTVNELVLNVQRKRPIEMDRFFVCSVLPKGSPKFLLGLLPFVYKNILKGGECFFQIQKE
eukprot:TRINITY_DN3987_c0_g2_i11.p1 TRINITY_DN3987_c0_g2~~TRINITY_DN3987_c0_g2_i11.p1  ORF type:complete len:155 (+),score=27.95 TRINITY_DN3987_c0_g2_i11:179-643(+)